MPMKLRPEPHEVETSWTVQDPRVVFAIPKDLTEEQQEVAQKFKKRDANDIMADGAAKYGKDGMIRGFKEWLDTSETIILQKPATSPSQIISLHTLAKFYPTMHEEVIDGLLRRQEVLNIIAPPKAGKSFLAGNIGMNIVGGGKVFGKFSCKQGRVLVIDNELHKPTIVQRNRDVAFALNAPFEIISHMIDYLPLRSRLTDMDALEHLLERIHPRYYTVVILDAFYKFYPPKFDENSNADMANIYTKLNLYADCLQSGLILIHHSSKGSQAGRSVADVGAGAGSQSRACDGHLILREHEDPFVYRIDAANRSFPSIEPFCCKFKYPVWEIAPNADPEALKGVDKKKGGGGYGDSKIGGSSAAQTAADGTPVQPVSEAAVKEQILRSITVPMDVQQIIALGGGRIRYWNKGTVWKQLKEWLRSKAIKQLDDSKGRRGATFICVLPPTDGQQTGNISQEREDDGADEAENIPF